MVERNAGTAADRRIEFRIGIHLGDVVEEPDGDLMGDNVNIAARIDMALRPPAKASVYASHEGITIESRDCHGTLRQAPRAPYPGVTNALLSAAATSHSVIQASK